ncbi:hypothetical protein FQZ97_1128120 [compost metagenome]
MQLRFLIAKTMSYFLFDKRGVAATFVLSRLKPLLQDGGRQPVAWVFRRNGGGPNPMGAGKRAKASRAWPAPTLATVRG